MGTIGAKPIFRIGLGGYYTIILIRSPPQIV